MGNPTTEVVKEFPGGKQAFIEEQRAKLSSKERLDLSDIIVCRQELEAFNRSQPSEALSLDDLFIGRSTPLALKLNDPQYQDYDQNVLIALLQGGIIISVPELTSILKNPKHHDLIKYITKENLPESVSFELLLAPIFTNSLPSEIQAWVVNLACQFENDAELPYVLERFSYTFPTKELSTESKNRIIKLLLEDFGITAANDASTSSSSVAPRGEVVASTSSRPSSSPSASEAVAIQLSAEMIFKLKEQIKTAINELITQARRGDGRNATKSLAAIRKIELFEDLGVVENNFSKKLFAAIEVTTQDFINMFTAWPKGFGATLLRKGIKLSHEDIKAMFYMRSTTAPIYPLVKFREAEVVAWLSDKTETKTDAYSKLQKLVKEFSKQKDVLGAARFMRVAYPNKGVAAWQQLFLVYQYMSRSYFDAQVWQELLTIIDVNVNTEFKPRVTPPERMSRVIVVLPPPQQSLLFFACQSHLNEAVYTALLEKGAEVNTEVLKQALGNEQMPLKVTCLLLLKAKDSVWAENQTAIIGKISSGTLTSATKVKTSKVEKFAKFLVTDELTVEQKKELVTKLLKNAGKKQKAFKDELHRQLKTANNGTLPSELRNIIINGSLDAPTKNGAALFSSSGGGINTDPGAAAKLGKQLV